MAETRTWLITGASAGLGNALALAVLQAGQQVIGTTRDPAKAELSCPEFSARGGVWLRLDPGHKDAFKHFVEVSEEHKIDVLVNNAGYAFIGGVEDTSENEMRDQMEVNFYGPLRVVKACLPQMRARGAGDIVLISSGAGFAARPGRSAYSASKFAIEAVHESLMYELKTFNINVLIVEPGAFRTSFAFRILTPKAHEATGGLSLDYKGTAVDQMITMSRGISDINAFAKGAPDKAALAIFKAVSSGHKYLRLPLGSDCVAALESKIGELQEDLDTSRSLATSTDVD